MDRGGGRLVPASVRSPTFYGDEAGPAPFFNARSSYAEYASVSNKLKPVMEPATRDKNGRWN